MNRFEKFKIALLYYTRVKEAKGEDIFEYMIKDGFTLDEQCEFGVNAVIDIAENDFENICKTKGENNGIK